MVGQPGAMHGIHSSGSSPTRSTPPIRFHHARPRARCHEDRPDRGQVLLGLTYLLFPANQWDQGIFLSARSDRRVPGIGDHFPDKDPQRFGQKLDSEDDGK
jgi:hypothetical protein